MDIKAIISLRNSLQADLATVEKFLDVARRNQGNGNGSLTPQSLNPETPVKDDPNQKPLKLNLGEKSYGDVGKKVLEAIKLCPLRYTIRHVGEALSELGTPLRPGSIATALRRFSHRGKIKIAAPGVGRKPTVYSKLE